VAETVVEHVSQTSSNLLGRLEDAAVEAVRHDLAPPAQFVVEVLGDPHTQPLHAPGQGLAVLGFAEQVQVVVLY